jgi:PPOX class probable F420-dependent enzyme
VWPGRSDLEGRLSDHPDVAHFERRPAHRHDPPAGHVTGRWEAEVGHGRIIGAMTADPILTPWQLDFLAGARRAVLATIAPDGRPRLVPICFVLDDDRPVVYSSLDEKPKRVVEPRQLARVRDLLRDPRVTILVDRWDEDWDRLAWLRCYGTASLVAAGADGAAGNHDGAREHRVAVAALRAKYPQYATHDLAGRPLIRIVLERATSWGRLGGDDR